MSPLVRLGLLALLVAAAGCNRTGPEIPKDVKDSAGTAESRDGIDTVTIDPNTAFVGSAVDANGDIATPQREFAVGDTVYISVPSKGRRMGSPVEVFWFHDDGKSRKDERKAIQGAFTVFELQAADPGTYNTEVDVDGRPVALVEFVVR